MKKIFCGFLILGSLSSFANCNIALKKDQCEWLMKEEPHFFSSEMCRYFYTNIEVAVRDLNFNLVKNEHEAPYKMEFGWSRRGKSYRPYVEIEDQSRKSETLGSFPTKEIEGSMSRNLTGVIELIDSIKNSGIVCK